MQTSTFHPQSNSRNHELKMRFSRRNEAPAKKKFQNQQVCALKYGREIVFCMPGISKATETITYALELKIQRRHVNQLKKRYLDNSVQNFNSFFNFNNMNEFSEQNAESKDVEQLRSTETESNFNSQTLGDQISG